MEITREQHFAIYEAIVVTLKETTEGLEDEEIFALANDILQNICNSLNITIKNNSLMELLEFAISKSIKET